MLRYVKSFIWAEAPEALKTQAKAISTTPVTQLEKKDVSATETKGDPQSVYKERLAKYKEATKDTEMSSLFKHILYVLDAKNCSSPSSIAKVLDRMGSSHPDFKGFAIHSFNAGHRGNNCPFFKNTPLSKSLHLGTTRIWKEDGSVDEMRWKKFLKEASDENGSIFRLSKVHAYLAECAEKDPEQKETGRHTTPLLPMSKESQVFAAVQAWNEVFDRLACGWKIKDAKTGEMEPYISAEVIWEFFVDSPVAYLRAECGLLPVAKPKVELVNTPAKLAS
jgi:hypothetical protein